MLKRFVLVALVGAVACEMPAECPKATPAEGNRALLALYEREWEWSLKEWPRWATTMGDHRYDDRWEDLSPEALKRRYAHERQVLEEIEKLPDGQFSSEDRLDRDLLRDRYEVLVASERFQLDVFPINQLDGVQQLEQVADDLVFDQPKRFADWNARMHALPVHVDQVIALLEEGIRKGLTHPRVVMERVTAQIHAHVVDDPEKSPFYRPYRSGGASQAADAKRIIAADVIPAYRKLETFWKERYLPACRATIAAEALPDGAARYAHLVRVNTSTRIPPDEIHAIGVREVARIHSEIGALETKIGFEGTLAQLLAKLRTDKQHMYASREDMLASFRILAKRVDPELTRLFRTLPRTPYGVTTIPDAAAADAPAAYYHEPADDGSRAGMFFLNTLHPEAHPKWEAPMLMMHEAVPGHHLQIALATERKDIPALRRHGDYNAYVEGWGLYAESLGDELGVYADPYSKLGQLLGEMWRAVRLVVDTGVHHFGWDRQKALAYCLENVGRSDMESELDRYIVWPGQALGYKLGELRIKELRRKKEAQLGAKFDIRDFHDSVLRGGPMPLDLLERQVMDGR